MDITEIKERIENDDTKKQDDDRIKNHIRGVLRYEVYTRSDLPDGVIEDVHGKAVSVFITEVEDKMYAFLIWYRGSVELELTEFREDSGYYILKGDGFHFVVENDIAYHEDAVLCELNYADYVNHMDRLKHLDDFMNILKHIF